MKVTIELSENDMLRIVIGVAIVTFLICHAYITPYIVDYAKYDSTNEYATQMQKNNMDAAASAFEGVKDESN